MTKLTIGPSSASFARGATVITDTPSSCPRYFIAKKAGFSPLVPKLYAAMGEIDENRWLVKFNRENPTALVEIQVPIFYDKLPNINIKGYIDAIVTYEDGRKVLIDKKSHISKSKRLEIIRKKTPQRSNIAQLVTYMLVTKIRHGQLIHDYYELDYDCTSLTATESITFDIELDTTSSNIYVNGRLYEHSLTSLVKFYSIINAQVGQEILSSRPSSKKSPCQWCPLSEICNESEIKGWGKSDFIEKVLMEIPSLTEKQRNSPPMLWAPRRKPKK